MNDGWDWTAIVTALAAVSGPIIAVWITRLSDGRKEVAARRMDIFRTLMRTRKMPIHIEHVGALNLIEVEFANDTPVIDAWKAYFENLHEPLPPDSDADAEIAFRNKRDAFLTKLIYEIAQVLNFKVEQLDILKGNYIPRAWTDDDWEQKIVRKSLIDVLGGRRPIVIQPYASDQGIGPYPPAPQVSEKDSG